MAPEARKFLNAAELLLVEGTEIGIGNMQKRKMINLILRVQDYLPVRFFLDSVATQQSLLIKRVSMNLLNHPRHILGESLGRMRVQVDENKPFPYVCGDRFQAQGALVDVVEVSLVGHKREPAGRVISPTVKAANEAALAQPLLVVDQPIAAM